MSQLEPYEIFTTDATWHQGSDGQRLHLPGKLVHSQEAPHACRQVLFWSSLVPIDFINRGAFSGKMMPRNIRIKVSLLFSVFFFFLKKRETQKENNNRKIWVQKTFFKQSREEKPNLANSGKPTHLAPSLLLNRKRVNAGPCGSGSPPIL